MTPDSMLTTLRMIRRAGRNTDRLGTEAALQAFKALEPELAHFVEHRTIQIAGKMALFGRPTELICDINSEVLWLVLTALEALRRGHYELWRGTVIGAQLEQRDNSLQPHLQDQNKIPKLPL